MSDLQTALDLARNGYYVHPLCWPTPDGHCGCGHNHTDREAGKAPLVAGGSTAATCDEATIRAWWQQWPLANIGLDLEQSGLVDIAPDCPTWAASFKANGMPRTVCYTSGSGWHTLYRRPADCPRYRSCKPCEYDLMSSGNAVAPGSTHRSGRQYTLKTSLSPVADLPEAPAWAVQMLRDAEQGRADSGDLDMALVEKRRGNIDVILARVSPTLPRMAREALEHPEHCPSYSEARYRVIGGLMHLPNEEIAALVFHWADEDKLPWGHLDGKSQRQKVGDITRVIGKHEARMSARGKPRTISPTRGAGLLPAQPITKPKARQDRPHRLDASALFAWYEQEANSSVVLMTVAEVATAHQVSDRTIQRLERQLDNLIERKAWHHQSVVTLLRQRGDNIAAVSPLENKCTTVPEAANHDRSVLYNHVFLSEQAAGEPTRDAATAAVTPAEREPGGGDQKNVPVSPAPAGAALVGYDAAGHRLGLAELVRDGLDAVTRPTLKRIRAYVLANAANPQAFSDNGIVTVYQRELKKRRYARQDARAVEKLQVLRTDVLKRKSRSIASQAADLHRRGNKQAPVFRRLAGIYAAEEARRAPPDQLTMHEQWAQVGAEYDQAHQALKKHARPVAKAATSVVDIPVDVGLVERLRILKAQREAAHVE